jgi:hypothetical protein
MAIHAHTHTIFSKDESEDQELARCVRLAVVWDCWWGGWGVCCEDVGCRV